MNPYVITLILGEDIEPILQKGDKVSGHLIHLVQVLVPVDVAEASSHRLVHEEEVAEFIPRALVILQRRIVLQPVGTDLHQRTIHRATSGASIQPDHGSLAVGDMAILEVPEEQVSVVLGVYFDVPGKSRGQYTCRSRNTRPWR